MQIIKIRRLQKDLNKLCLELSKIYDVNEGGCCFLAYIIAKYLDKLELPYKLVIFTDEYKSIKNIKRELNIKKPNLSNKSSIVENGTCCHYSIYLKKGGLINPIMDGIDYIKYSITGINYKQLKWIYKNGYWNSQYNKYNNKEIQKVLNNFFKPYLYEKEI